MIDKTNIMEWVLLMLIEIDASICMRQSFKLLTLESFRVIIWR
jgi:hypothetical protein